MVSYKALNTAFKSVIPNTFHSIRDVDISEGFTVRKSPIPNTCNTFWNVDVDKRFAKAKSFICNNLHSYSDRTLIPQLSA